MFMMVDYVREMTVKKSCKYSKFGSIEHLLFLCCNRCCKTIDNNAILFIVTGFWQGNLVLQVVDRVHQL